MDLLGYTCKSTVAPPFPPFPISPPFPNLPNGQVRRDIRVLASHTRRPLQGLDEGGLEAFLFRFLRWRGRARSIAEHLDRKCSAIVELVSPLFPNLPNGQVRRNIRVLAFHARRLLEGLDEGGLEAFLFRVLRWRGRARCYGRRRRQRQVQHPRYGSVCMQRVGVRVPELPR